MALASACLTILVPTSVRGAETATVAQQRQAAPRIGIALSGGGARGLAHIGVLKVLEELRVPVHCITGTSMGAIVAGSYASGTSAAELEELVLKADWDEIFRDRPQRADTASRRKVDDYKTLFAPEYGVKDGGLALPKGIIAGVSIEEFFRQLAEPAIGIDDFQKLPIPFRAMATDIETGESVVIDRGSVAHAMRASMSVPGAIAPVEFNGRLLVDGGIANNLPIDETRKLCADVVIAVNISTPPLKREELTSSLSVTVQLLNFLGLATVEAQLKSLGSRDVLIAPDLGNISAASFEQAAATIKIGEDAARANTDRLKRYSLPAEQYAALRAKQVVARKGLGTVDEIRFEGLARTNPEVLRPLVASKTGESLTEEKIGKDLQRIYGRGDFESIDYRIMGEPGSRALVIQPREKEWGPDYLRFGLGLASDFQGDSAFNVLVSYRKSWLNRLGGEWLSEMQIGKDNYLFTELYQPVEESGRFFVAPYARIGATSRGVFVGETRVAEYDIKEARLGLDTGVTFGAWGEARLGAVTRHVETNLDTGLSLYPALEETTAGARLLMFGDQLDNPWFPRHGYRMVGSAYWADDSLGSDRNYKRLEGQILGVTSWGAHTVQLALAGGTDLDSDLPAYEAFTLGGPLRLSGYRIGEFSGRRMTFGRLMYYNRTIALPDLLGSGVFLGASVEAGRIKEQFSGVEVPGTIWSGSVFLGANTFVGPAYFGFGLGEHGRASLYLLLGAP